MKIVLALVVLVACGRGDAPTPSRSNAYRDGGIPTRDPQIEKILYGDLTNAGPLPATYGPALPAAWSAMLTSKLDDRELRIRDVDNALVAAGLAYRIDLELQPDGMSSTTIDVFAVERVVIVEISGKRYPVTVVSSPHERRPKYRPQGVANGGPAKIFRERIEESATTELRELGSTIDRELANTGTLEASEAARAFRRAMAPKIHETWLAFLGADATAARRISELLVERGQLVTDSDLDGFLFLPADKIPAAQRAQIEVIEREIRRLEGPRIVARMTEVLVASGCRHEARHMADEAITAELDERAMDFIGELGMDIMQPRFLEAQAAIRELSAYLHQLATDDDTTLYTLWFVTAAVFVDPLKPESYVAAKIASGLVRILDGTHELYARDGKIDLDRYVPAALALAKRSPRELREAAAKLRAEYFAP